MHLGERTGLVVACPVGGPSSGEEDKVADQKEVRGGRKENTLLREIRKAIYTERLCQGVY